MATQLLYDAINDNLCGTSTTLEACDCEIDCCANTPNQIACCTQAATSLQLVVDGVTNIQCNCTDIDGIYQLDFDAPFCANGELFCVYGIDVPFEETCGGQLPFMELNVDLTISPLAEPPILIQLGIVMGYPPNPLLLPYTFAGYSKIYNGAFEDLDVTFGPADFDFAERELACNVSAAATFHLTHTA